MSNTQALPFVDEHSVLVAAPAAVVWERLGASLRRQALARRAAAPLLGTDPRAGEGDPLRVGSTIPGFAVQEAHPGSRLVLAGRHRFSEYRLTFLLAEREGTTRLAARSEARFPGLHGKAYRALVIGSAGHRLLVRRWLQRIRDDAEHRS